MHTARKLLDVTSQWKHEVPTPETGEEAPVLVDQLHQGATVYFPEGEGTLVDYDPELKAFLVDGGENGFWAVPMTDIRLVKEDVQPRSKVFTRSELKHEVLARGYNYTTSYGTYYVVIPSLESEKPATLLAMTQENVLGLHQLIRLNPS